MSAIPKSSIAVDLTPGNTLSARRIRVLRMLSACSRTVMKATSEIELLNEICKTIVDTGGYTHFWVGYAMNDAEKTVKPMAQVGFKQGAFGIDRVSWDERSSRGQGIFGVAIRTKKPAVIRDCLNSTPYSEWHDIARTYHYNSLLGLPLFVDGEPIGAIGFYQADREGFDDEEVELLQEVAGDLGHGISVIRMREARKRDSLALEQANRDLEMKIEERTAALFEEKERAQVTLHAIGEAVITTNISGQIDYLNPVAETLTGWTNARAKGMHLQDIFRVVNVNTPDEIHNAVEAALKAGSLVRPSGNYLLTHRNGTQFAIEQSAAPIRNRHGEIIGVVLVFDDVSESRKTADQLTYQATHDSLTGLLNRREFETRILNALETAGRRPCHYAVLYVDLDQFKLVNDTCGHVAGDELLRSLTSLLEKRLRKNDSLARLGGDEFGVLLEDCTPEAALRVAEGLRQMVSDFHFVWQGKSFKVGASIGLVNFDNNLSPLSEILKAADTACYAAKDRGRNQVYVFRPDDESMANRQKEMQWVGRIRAALEDNRFQLYYQPIVTLSDDRQERIHYELLIRLRDEDNVLVPPMAFIPSAERYNLMPEIDRWVIHTALQHFGNLCPDQDGVCAINLSGASLSGGQLLPFIREQLACFAVPPSQLCFEITETVAIGNLSDAIKLVTELKAIGCRFALDDFGSGMSSFAYLKHLHIDYLKIDGAFVKNMLNDSVDLAMVNSINDIGHIMGIKTIAEFVENEQICERLKAMKVDFAQGYGIAKPAPCLYLEQW